MIVVAKVRIFEVVFLGYFERQNLARQVIVESLK
jgi:hypothetical protein